MIRYLENSEKQNIRQLYDHCFHDDKEYTDYYFENILPSSHVAVNEKNNEIAGALHLISKNVIMGKLKNNITYIYGVGTFEQYRCKGIMKELFTKVIRDIYTNMDSFTYLIPSDATNAAIYRKLGFEYVMDQHMMKEPEQRKKATRSLILRKAENADLIKMSIFAQAAVEKKYGVAMVKDLDYFKKIKELIDIEGGHIEIYVQNKVVVGYRIWLEGEIFEEVLDSSIQTLSWLGNERKPYAMARILNVRKTLRLFEFKHFEAAVIKITDPVIEENNGYFELKYVHGNLRFDKVDEKTITTEPKYDVTIGELTAHIFGYRTIEGFPQVCGKDSFFINDYV